MDKSHTAERILNWIYVYIYTVYCNHTAISIEVVTDNSQMSNNMSVKWIMGIVIVLNKFNTSNIL
jgi:hypothetical protein